MATKTAQSKQKQDAISILKADHDKVKKMFKQFKALHENEEDDQAAELVGQICNELKIHTAVEEEIFYPALREVIDDEDLMDEAEVEHQSAKELIEKIEGGSEQGDKHAAMVTVLGEYVNHHIEEEQDEMFPKAKRAKLDLEELGQQIMTRKQELKAESGEEEDSEEEERERRGASGRSKNRRAA
jgi:hypothetical protein